MKLWLDDSRPAPAGWTWAHDQAEFAELVAAHVDAIEEVAFDFYLEIGDSRECCEALFEACARAGRELPRWTTHSSSPSANRLLARILRAHAAILRAGRAGV